MALVQKRKATVEKWHSNVLKEVRKTYGDMVGMRKRKIEEGLVDGWKQVGTHC